MVPKKLHFTYKKSELPEKYQANLAKWSDLCPEWELYYYTDEDVQAYFDCEFPEYSEDLQKISVGAMLADVFRYAVLYKEGGLYSDIDTIPLKSIPDEWLKFDAVIGYEYQPDRFPELLSKQWKYEPIYCQWTFLASPGNPLFKEALDRSFRKLRAANFEPKKRIDILHLSGPLLFTSVVNDFQNASNHLILDADYFATDSAKNFPKTKRSVIKHQFDGHHGWEWNVLLPHVNLEESDANS